MYRKNNPLIAASFEVKEEIFAPFSDEIMKIGVNLSFLQRKHKLLPMYLHSFRFIAPKKVSEAQKFVLKFPTADKIETVADKLRYYRYQKGLHQSDVADYLGIERSTYIDYENPDREYYSAEVMERISELFCVDVYDLLDDYNKFLYDGQGRNIKELREKLNITQEELAREMNVSLLKVKRWEQNKVRMFKFTYDKLMMLFSESKQNIS